jgi:hypothetical protein
METTSSPRLPELQPEPESEHYLQSKASAELTALAKGFVNDWLTVTNWVPHVNDAQGHFWLLKTGNRESPLDRLPAV